MGTKTFLKKKSRHKPLFKQFLKLWSNPQNRKKLLNFRKQKWKSLIEQYKKRFKWFKKFKAYDHEQYSMLRYTNKYSGYKQRFGIKFQVAKRLKLFYGGGFLRRTFKKQLNLPFKDPKKKNFRFLLLEFFEKRLDTVLYRSRFSKSIRNARQLILHGKIFVNGKQIKIKSFFLKPGDLITIDPKYSYMIKYNLTGIERVWPLPPRHLLINYKTLQILLIKMDYTSFSMDFPFPLKLHKIII